MKISMLYYSPTIIKSLLCPLASINSLGNWTGMFTAWGEGVQRKDGKLGGHMTTLDCKFQESTNSGQEMTSHTLSRNLANKREFCFI